MVHATDFDALFAVKEKNEKKLQFVLCELLFLCYTTKDNNRGNLRV